MTAAFLTTDAGDTGCTCGGEGALQLVPAIQSTEKIEINVRRRFVIFTLELKIVPTLQTGAVSKFLFLLMLRGILFGDKFLQI